jgi:hypothetical protein
MARAIYIMYLDQELHDKLFETPDQLNCAPQLFFVGKSNLSHKVG